MITDLMKTEVKFGLILNPYKKTRPQISVNERTKILTVLSVVQSSACISDYAFLTAVFMFDKVMEGLSLHSTSRANQLGTQKKEFKIATACLYLAAKCEDPKYPYFECYKNLVLDKTVNMPQLKQQIADAFRSQELQAEELIDMELFIWKHICLNMHIPVSIKYYERFARCAFADSPTRTQDLNLGLYLLYIASFYPGIQFEFSQSLIAASAVHCVLRIRENQWTWSEYLHNEVTCGAFTEKDLRACSYRLVRKYVGLTSRKDQKYEERLWFIEKKFSHTNYSKAATVRPTRTE